MPDTTSLIRQARLYAAHAPEALPEQFQEEGREFLAANAADMARLLGQMAEMLCAYRMLWHEAAVEARRCRRISAVED